MREFTKEDLAQYNGRNGASAFIAYRGTVYDLSDSFHWRSGVHQVLHSAGEDMTDSIHQAPHDEDLLKRFIVVVKLI